MTDQATESQQPSPPMGVSSSECIGLLDEAQAPTLPAVGQMQGWCCPRCGRGNSPFNPVCPCMPMPAPQRMSLTDEQIEDIAGNTRPCANRDILFARAVERHYGIGEPTCPVNPPV